ncbi:AAA family ATPase [Campylobacter sp.]|uniref:AAA family ATPase n=1 Tax=Campylobacter sp. TaxID=205 RepID=UPI002A8285B6|nr:AAA family ATPase [Campylobacter sp.]MDY4445606.1 AAA family ATPase [Campylobacter sp.]
MKEIKMQINAQDLVEVLKGSKNIILHGAPGTGKTHLAKQIAEELGAEYEFVQFHPSYDYTDFVEGLRPVNENGQVVFKRKDGIFKEFCKKALLDKSFIKKSEFVKEKLLKFYDEKLSIFTNFNTDKKWKNAPLFELAYSRLIEKIKENGDSGLKLDNKYFAGRSFQVIFENGQIKGTFNGTPVSYSKPLLSKCFIGPDEYNKNGKGRSLEASIGKYMRTLVENIDDVKISFDEFYEIFSLA